MTPLLRILKNAVPVRVKRTIHEEYTRLFDRHTHSAAAAYHSTDVDLKLVHILEAINYVRVAALPPVYLEFGCHSARTFSAAVRAARYLRLKDARFFAFDSFQGLPAVDAAEDGTFKSGAFATPRDEFVKLVKKKSGLSLPAEHIIEGFYSHSLTSDLQRRIPRAGVIHIDVDLYSSTVEVLEFIRPLLVVGTVLLFDDWYAFPVGTNKGEARAVQEFAERNPAFQLEPWKAYSTFGRSFFVTSTPV